MVEGVVAGTAAGATPTGAAPAAGGLKAAGGGGNDDGAAAGWTAAGGESIDAGTNPADDAGGSTLPPEKRLPLTAP